MSESDSQSIVFKGLIGRCGDREVFLGFAPAATLSKLSFADVLDEKAGRGYQRRFSREHSLAFRKYIRTAGATTIPLTFNLRSSPPGQWKLRKGKTPADAELVLSPVGHRVLAQVDCQHRLGHLTDLDVPLAFMTFLGLSIDEEMQIFNIINGKAKGLSSSLLDFHEAQLTKKLGTIRPELLIALQLAEDSRSPWYQRLDLGGEPTVGMYRYASLRTMQKAAKRFLKESGALSRQPVEAIADIAIDFWIAVSEVLHHEWNRPRKSLITKGIGVYSLMSLAGELNREAHENNRICDATYFSASLSDFITDIDWSSNGPLRGYGGTAGADQAFELIRTIRQRSIGAILNGKQEYLAH